MADSAFVTVFSADTYHNWWFPALGLIFIAVGLVLPKLFDLNVFSAYQKRMFGEWFPALFLGFAIFWTAAIFLVTFGGYWEGREALLSGNTQYVEGPVQNFVALVDHHNEESFDVNGVPFHYSDGTIGAGFNQTESRGGPVHSGTYVRIWYSGNDILKLQVRK